MSAQCVVDSSVAHKWLHPIAEDGVAEALEIVHRHLGGEIILVAPALMPAEVANALKWKRRLDEADVLELIDNLAAIAVALFDMTYERLSEATRLSYRHRISVYDALFLQLAEELDCPLVTADRRAFEGIETDVEIRLL